MTGLALSEKYFEEVGRPAFLKTCGDIYDSLAFALCGEGSECMGFDDELSRDHDFGPGFLVLVNDETYEKHAPLLWEVYSSLPKEFMGYARKDTVEGQGRMGVWRIWDFFGKFTGRRRLPESDLEWFRIPSEFLANTVNGRVFSDPSEEFTKIREYYRGFYPIEVIKKKLAAKLAIMAQSGQYNYPRIAKRGDSAACFLAKSEFVTAASKVVFLLNATYIPFYKWMFRAMEDLPQGKDVIRKIKLLSETPGDPGSFDHCRDLMEEISSDITEMLRFRSLTKTNDTFLEAHARELMASIKDESLRNLHIMADF